MTVDGTEIAPEATSETVVAVDAALFKETVQVEVALLPSVDGVQLKLVSCAGTGAVAFSVKDCEPPFSVAVICVL